MTGKNIGDLLGFVHCGGKQPICKEDEMNFTVTKSKGKPSGALKITIGPGLIAQMRWVGGDRISLNIDPVRSEGTLIRVPATGTVPTWALTVRKQQYRGSTIIGNQGIVQISIRPKMLEILGLEDTVSYRPAPVVTSTEGITFPLAKQWKVVSRG